MVMKVRHYADGGKVELPGPETRRVKPTPLPPPKKGPKPKKLADGGKVTAKPPTPRPRTPAARPAPAPKPPAPERRASTVDIMRGKTRREAEQALGLKDGGKVKKRR